jgi:hypothetical protein
VSGLCPGQLGRRIKMSFKLFLIIFWLLLVAFFLYVILFSKEGKEYWRR